MDNKRLVSDMVDTYIAADMLEEKLRNTLGLIFKDLGETHYIDELDLVRYNAVTTIVECVSELKDERLTEELRGEIRNILDNYNKSTDTVSIIIERAKTVKDNKLKKKVSKKEVRKIDLSEFYRKKTEVINKIKEVKA